MEDVVFWLAMIGVSYLLFILTMFCGRWVDWLENRFSVIGNPSGIRYIGYIVLYFSLNILTILCLVNLISLLIMWLDSKLTGFVLASQEKEFEAKCSECIWAQVNNRNSSDV